MYVPELGQMVGVGITIGVGVVAGVGVSVTVTVLIVMISDNVPAHKTIKKMMQFVPIHSSNKKKERRFCYSMFARENDVMLLEIFVNVPCTVYDGEGTEFTCDVQHILVRSSSIYCIGMEYTEHIEVLPAVVTKSLSIKCYFKQTYL